MKRLIQHGLMFGNLFHVASPALVERYNRALKHLTGKTTSLADFQNLMEGLLAADLQIDRYMTYIVTREVKSARPDIAGLLADGDR